MNPAATAAALLADNPNLTVEELTAFASDMDPKAEDEFWAAVREINPTLCPDW